MIAASDPNMLIAKLAIGGLMIGLFWRFLFWVREAPTTPDPWDAETDKKLSEPETSQACHHCSTPLATTAWFCPHCGSAVGPYNNMMPYVFIFSEGEVLRNSTSRNFRTRPLIIIGYLLVALGMTPILTYAYLRIPVCWLFPILLVLFLKNIFGDEDQEED
ncbi:MAG: hypothetical protein P4N60_10275 [Verrucomicrobiae bacterium]|nr:hypothetical protein [Verrucomicrobiae bacterium]